MFSALADLQNAVVVALLDRADAIAAWRAIHVHAEFGGADAVMESLTEAFLVADRDDPVAPTYFPLTITVSDALLALWRGYEAAGQGFTQLDLTISDKEGRYRFEFSDQRAPRLHGERDPSADARLLARFAELARGA